MEKPKRARRRKPETAKANLKPPLDELRRTGCPPRGGIRRVCGDQGRVRGRPTPNRGSGTTRERQGQAPFSKTAKPLTNLRRSDGQAGCATGRLDKPDSFR